MHDRDAERVMKARVSYDYLRVMRMVKAVRQTSRDSLKANVQVKEIADENTKAKTKD
jgi:hypothetical protein